MKVFPYLIMIFLVGCAKVLDNSHASNPQFLRLEEDSHLKKVFRTSQGSTFSDYFLVQKFLFNGKEYSARARAYSETDIDTVFYRNIQAGLVYVDPKTFIETLDLPSNPKVGQKWKEPTNWIYEVKDLNAILKTPYKEYNNLIEIEATQTTGETKEKFLKYNNFYAKDSGYVGSIVKGELFSYLEEVVEIKDLENMN